MHICNQAVTSCGQKTSDSCTQIRSNRDISFQNVGWMLGCVETFAGSNLETVLVKLGYWGPGKDSWNWTRITRYVVTAPTIWNRQRLSFRTKSHNPKMHSSSHLTPSHPNVIIPALFLLLIVPPLTKLHTTDIFLRTIVETLQLDSYPSCFTKLVGLLPSSLQTSWAT